MKFLWAVAAFWVFARSTVGAGFQEHDMSGWVISLVILVVLLWVEAYRAYSATKGGRE